MLVFSLMLAVNLFAQTSTPPSSGTGTSGDPYLIATLDNLYWVTQNSSSWDKYFKQTADINAATSSGWDGGAGFLPIGNTSTPFTGSYNGQGGIISSLTINRPSVSFVGMFGYVEGGEIVNLGIDTDITGSGYVGAIAGCASFSSTISNCLTDGTLTGDYYTGGVVGSLEEGSTLDKSGSLSSVSGQRYVGGLVGRNLAAITDCYASGSVNGSVSDEGGLVGGNTSTPSVSNSFWDTETSTLAASAGGTGKTTSEMKTLATYTSTASSGLTTPWDFVGTPNDDAGIADWWNMDASETNFGGYPIPSWYAFTSTPSGDGSSGAPYQIATLNHLYWLSQLSTTYPAYVYVEQTADIPAYSTAYINSGQGFLPVGNPDYFVGSYNGQQHEISGLFINRSTTNQVGFFSSLYVESIVLDLHLTELDILGNFRVGGLVGNASSSNITIRRTSCSGNVKALDNQVGLLAGIMQISGIIVEECWTEGTVTGVSEVGGLIGRCGGAASVGISMSDCYSRADVIAGNTAGGLIGKLLQGVHTGVQIEHCYSTGTVTGNSVIGGLFGYEATDLSLVTLTANFWDTESSGLTDGVGSLDPDPAGITGKTTAQMKTESTFTNAGWDFTTIWAMDGTTNDGYAYLQGSSAATVTFFSGENFEPSITVGQNNQPIGRFSLSADILGSSLTGADITLTGTFSGADNFKFWHSEDDNFNSDEDNLLTPTENRASVHVLPKSEFSAVKTGRSNMRENVIEFSNFSSSIMLTPEYYFVTCDVASDATGSIQPILQDNSSLSFSNGSLSGTISNAPLSGDDTPLPVLLSSFTGNIENGLPTLYWTTESELENMGWNVFRSEHENSIEQNNYLQLNEILIPGMGTFTEPTDYSFIDEYTVQSGEFYYYWLQSISNSGETELFGPVEIEIYDSGLPEVPSNSYLGTNRPNPFNPTTTIEFGIKEGEGGVLSIYNVLGQKILSQKYEAGFHTFIWDA